MFHLIKKDILMQKKSFALAILLMFFFTFTLSNIGPVGLSIGILAITYQLGLGASALEDKNNSDIILISLPIKKTTIVLSKYLSIFVYLAYALIGFSLIYLIANVFAVPYEIPLTKEGIVSAIASVIVFFSISYPLIFKYGYLKSKMPNLIIFFVLVFGGTTMIVNLSNNEQSVIGQKLASLLQGSDTMFTILMIIVLAMIWTVSYFISLTFYRKREF